MQASSTKNKWIFPVKKSINLPLPYLFLLQQDCPIGSFILPLAKGTILQSILILS